MSIRWQSITKFRTDSIPSSLYLCLQETGSLIQHLDKYCTGRLELYLKSQSWKKPLKDETQKLKISPGENALIREIYFKCENDPWIYARSIIPSKTLRGEQRLLARLGQQSLGSYLFSERTAFRGKMEIAKIFSKDRFLFPAINAFTNGNDNLWGRRSVFYIKDKPLLIIEIFLPDGIKCVISGKK